MQWVIGFGSGWGAASAVRLWLFRACGEMDMYWHCVECMGVVRCVGCIAGEGLSLDLSLGPGVGVGV